MDAAQGYSVLLVEVPAFESVVRPRLERWAPDFLQADPAAVHSHITLLAPFLPLARLDAGVLARLGSVFGAAAPFDVTFARLDRFANDGLVHVVPEPAEPWTSLTAQLVTLWPECPPYGGAFEHVAPHVSLDHADSIEPLLAEVELPVTMRVTEAALVWYQERQTRVLRRFALG